MINKEANLAREFIEKTDQNLFLTGRAGTGKTTFLHQLKENSVKRMIITAPTGVAAINAGGVTLHSFFQLPFAPYIPGSALPQSFRFGREKKNIINSLDLLVIDEISMVRADVIDAIDSILRRLRKNSKPFGGVQLLMIGDLYQLPPVVKDMEWGFLQQHYHSPYFFSSQVLKQNSLISIELQHIYRQSDPSFINLLNQIRENNLSDDAMQLLNARYQAGFQVDENENFITLTTHNHSADQINQKHLSQTTGEVRYFQAAIEGDFPKPYPTAENLALKKGAQVMFIRNDRNEDKQFFNGKIGTIVNILENSVIVHCAEEDSQIEVGTEVWENIRYSLDQDSNEIIEEIIGSFIQLPLRLAWAITIHKSQGLTFDKLIIDGQAAFAHGQIYVALSRCKTLQGLVLSSPLSSHNVITDQAVNLFNQELRKHPVDEQRLNQTSIIYQQQLLLDCFDYQPLSKCFNQQLWLLKQHRSLIHFQGSEQLDELQNQYYHEISNVAAKFQKQLQEIFQQTVLPEADPQVLERLSKAGIYFSEKLNAGLAQWLNQFNFSCDNKKITQQVNQAIDNLQQLLCVKQAALDCCSKGFILKQYLSDTALAKIIQPKPSTNKNKMKAIEILESDLSHPKLALQLKLWRNEQASKNNLPHFQILHQRVIYQLSELLPGNMSALQEVPGIGPGKLQKYGEQLLKIILDYCHEYEINTNDKIALTSSKPPLQTQKKNQISTHVITLNLFKEGFPIEEIAKQRALVVSTIESHLAKCIHNGDIELHQLMEQSQIDEIEAAITKVGQKQLSLIKEFVGDKFSYSQIRYVLATQ